MALRPLSGAWGGGSEGGSPGLGRSGEAGSGLSGGGRDPGQCGADEFRRRKRGGGRDERWLGIARGVRGRAAALWVGEARGISFAPLLFRGPLSLSRGMKGNGTRHRSLESAHRGSGTRESSAIVWRSLPFLPGDSGEHAGDSRRSPCPAHFQRGGFHRKAPNGVKYPSRRRARSMGAYVPRAPF